MRINSAISISEQIKTNYLLINLIKVLALFDYLTNFWCVILGGKTFGPRGPNSYFYMLPHSTRLAGLYTALSVKYAQVSRVVRKCVCTVQ